MTKEQIEGLSDDVFDEAFTTLTKTRLDLDAAQRVAEAVRKTFIEELSHEIRD